MQPGLTPNKSDVYVLYKSISEWPKIGVSYNDRAAGAVSLVRPAPEVRTDVVPAPKPQELAER